MTLPIQTFWKDMQYQTKLRYAELKNKAGKCR